MTLEYFMSRPTNKVVAGGKMEPAMQIILTLLAHRP